jgi:hypothetical protein
MMLSISTLAILSSVLLFPIFFGNGVLAQADGKDSISLMTTVEPQSFPGDIHPGIPQKSNFTFGSGSPLCPANDCKQELIEAIFTGGAYPQILGSLKIENKTTSTPDIIKYSQIPFAGNFQITDVEENRKTGSSIIVFTGDLLCLGGGTTELDATVNPEFKYRITGTYDNVTRDLKIEGDRVMS